VLSDLIFVKKEWAGIDQDMQRDHRPILIVTAVVMFLATAGVFVTLALQMEKGTESFVAEALSYGLFFAVPVLCVSLSMLLIWLILFWMVRSHPTRTRSIGLDFERMGHKVLEAGILISHLWVVLFYSSSLPDSKPWPCPDLPGQIWSVRRVV